jgi:broad specificity phosphatase PhoE
MPQVYWIRHGQSTSNAGGAAPDLPGKVRITDLGEMQAESVRDYFIAHNIEPDLIITSSYRRTKQTAAPTIRHFGLKGDAVQEWPLTDEFHYLSPKASADLTQVQRKGKVTAYWDKADPDYVDGGKGSGAESFNEFIGRARETKKRLEAMPDDEIVVVFGHGQFITAVKWLMEQERKGKEDSEDFAELSDQIKQEEYQKFSRYIITSASMADRQIPEAVHKKLPNAQMITWKGMEEFRSLSDEHASLSAEESEKHLANFWTRGAPGDIDGNGAESFSQFVSRAKKFIQSVKTELPEDAAMVIFAGEDFLQLRRLLQQHPEAPDKELMDRFYEDAVELPAVGKKAANPIDYLPGFWLDTPGQAVDMAKLHFSSERERQAYWQKRTEQSSGPIKWLM